MTITEPQTGTMPVAEGTKLPEAQGKTPEKDKGTSGEEKLYTQKQIDALIHAAKSEAGRTAKQAEKERDDSKSQAERLQSQIDDIQSERETLQQQIEDLSSNDPKKFDLIKKDKELRDRERKTREKERTLEARDKASAEKIAKAEAFEVELLCETVADGYEGGDAKILHTICKTAGVKDEEGIRNLADTLFGKQVQVPTGGKEPLKTYSGYTEGGGSESFESLIKKDVKNMTYQERLEHQKKLQSARKVIKPGG